MFALGTDLDFDGDFDGSDAPFQLFSLRNLINFYNKDNNMDKMLTIINGESTISLRIVDWFATNYSKQYYITYDLNDKDRFKVYVDYKLKLRAYSKKRFDPFCRWDRITVPYKDGKYIG